MGIEKVSLFYRYGRKLVIVANQKMRSAVLMQDVDPLLELQNVEYCVLERIGRSRKIGILTQGNMSLYNQLKMDCTSLFHYRKQLIRYGLIQKQFFYIRSQETEQNKFGGLMHLRKFYTRIKPKQLLILEQMVNILKTQPSHRMPVMEMKKYFQECEPIIKISKTLGFRKFIRKDTVSITHKHFVT